MNQVIGLVKNIQTSTEKSCTTSEEIEEYIMSIADAYLDIIPNGIYCGLEDGTYIDKMWTPGSDWVMKERPWYTEGLKADEVTFGESYLDADSGEYIISIYANIKNSSNKVIGVISADLPLTSLKDALEAQQIGVSGYAFAIDETTGLILGNREQEDWNGQTVDDIIIDTVKDITANETYGEVTTAGKYFISANKIPNTNFVTVVVVPKQDVTTRAAGIKNASFITMAVGIVIQVIVILVILTLLMRPVPKIDKAINQIKDLDFTTACAVKSSDELGRIGKNMNQLDEKLKETMKRIRSGITRMDAQTDTNMEVAAHLQESAENQLESMHNLTDTLEGLNEGIHVIAEGTDGLTMNVHDTTQASEQVNEKIHGAVSLVQDGKLQVGYMNETMESISGVFMELQEAVGNVSEGIEGINNMVQVIQDIADQTNLLALNASIEAARAGEAGKGFAVVADEIRKLAEECGNSAVDIVSVTSKMGDLIGVVTEKTSQSIEKVNTGVENVSNTSDVFEQINQSVTEISNLMDTVNAAIGNISNVITDMAASVEEQTASTQVISETYRSVMDIFEEFSKDGDKVVEAGQELKKIVVEITEEIAKFKVD
ncbi:methyl-accepting chemotaxis protein [Thermoguttaceae bacterium LCP21S3_D4]